MWSWILIGSAGGAGVLAGVLGGMMSSAQGDADTAFTNYQSSTAIASGQGAKGEVEALDDEVQSLGIAVGIVSAVAAGALGSAIYLLVSTPDTPPPGSADSAGYRLTPWVGERSGGLGLHGRF